MIKHARNLLIHNAVVLVTPKVTNNPKMISSCLASLGKERNVNVMFSHKSQNGITKGQNKDFPCIFNAFLLIPWRSRMSNKHLQKMVNSGSSKTLLFKNTSTI